MFSFAATWILRPFVVCRTRTIPCFSAIIVAWSWGSDNLGNAFYEVKVATFPGESLQFGDSIQSLGQMASGAMPSLFGGDIQGSKTASQYSMSRAPRF